MVAFAVHDFWSGRSAARRVSAARTLSFEALAHEPGSPGRVFAWDENALADLLFEIEEVSDGAYRWSETAGLKQLICEREMSLDESLELIAGFRSRAAKECRMTMLAERVNVARRYQRAIRIDTDFGDPAALEGFVCRQSSSETLETMAHHAIETGQGAFTWTGPYGTGKSSLAVVLGALLKGKGALRSEAQSIVENRLRRLFCRHFRPVAVAGAYCLLAGRRDRPAQVIGEAISDAGLLKTAGELSNWSEKQVLGALEGIAASHPRAGGGLAVFITNLESFWRGGPRRNGHTFFQQLAEVGISQRRQVAGRRHIAPSL